MIEDSMIELQDADQHPGQTDTAALRRVYSRFPTGVMAVCAMHDGDPAGFAASSFVVVSAQPPLVAVCVQRASASWSLISASPSIGLSVLSAGQDQLCQQLAARGVFDKFIGAGWSATANGAVLIEGATAWLECATQSVTLAGDHELVLMKVRRHGVNGHGVNGDVAPLIFHASGFHQLGSA